jgi:acyl-CoA synthetase (AMP-forming)/AMP-acid ligase II
MSTADDSRLRMTHSSSRAPHRGIVEVLLQQRDVDATRPRLHVVENAGAHFEERPVSLGELYASAGRAAYALEAAGARTGDRVLLCLADPRTFLAWFLGALGRGMIAVPSPPLETLGASAHPAARVGAILEDCGPSVAVVERTSDFKHALPDACLPVLEELAIDDVAGPALELADPTGEAPAFLQYTSGSTGGPKGVVITHANLMANLEGMSAASDITDRDRIFSWLPLHHDMGLIGGNLWPLFAGGEAFVTKPFSFITRPVSWLQGIARFRATITLAPNFAYSVCAHRIPDRQLEGLDLSSLRVAICGAEPIDIGVVHAFMRRFATHGLDPRAFYPVYGLAEATLAVSFPEPGAEVRVDVVDRRRLATTGRAEPAPEDAPHAQTLISVGSALPGHAIEIRAIDTGLPCEERRVGQVMVRGPSLSARYWTDPVETKRDLLATGDLGYLADAELFIVDRLKDLVIIAGENYASSDIETAATEGTGARRGRVVAFAVRRHEMGTEAAIVVAEVDPNNVSKAASIRSTIEAAVRRRIGIQCEVVLTPPGSIEKTTSGKLRRSACAARYVEGTLATIEDRADTARAGSANVNRTPAPMGKEADGVKAGALMGATYPRDPPPGL